jgi:hypothetical protein
MTGPLLELSFCAKSPVPVLNISLSLSLSLSGIRRIIHTEERDWTLGSCGCDDGDIREKLLSWGGGIKACTLRGSVTSKEEKIDS